MDRGRAPNGIGHLMIARPKGGLFRYHVKRIHFTMQGPSKHACTVSVLVKYRQYWQYRQQYCRYRMGTDPEVFCQYRNGTVLPVQFLFWFFTESLMPISGT